MDWPQNDFDLWPPATRFLSLLSLWRLWGRWRGTGKATTWRVWCPTMAAASRWPSTRWANAGRRTPSARTRVWCSACPSTPSGRISSWPRSAMCECTTSSNRSSPRNWWPTANGFQAWPSIQEVRNGTFLKGSPWLHSKLYLFSLKKGDVLENLIWISNAMKAY